MSDLVRRTLAIARHRVRGPRSIYSVRSGTQGTYHRFQWSPVALARNAILQRYEPLQPHSLPALAKQVGAKTFLDIGANIGAYTTLLSDLPNPHAFEALPATAAEMRRVFALNSLDVNVHECALSDRNGDVTFAVLSDFSGANGVAETSIHKSKKIREEITIAAKRLDDIPIEIIAPLVVKIDVEGHEAQVLAGAKETLCNNQTIIQVESYQSNAEILGNYGFTKFLELGPDTYWSNFPVAPIPAIEEATRTLIEFSKFVRDPLRPLSLRLGPVRMQLMPPLSLSVRRMLGKP